MRRLQSCFPLCFRLRIGLTRTMAVVRWLLEATVLPRRGKTLGMVVHLCLVKVGPRLVRWGGREAQGYWSFESGGCMYL